MSSTEKPTSRLCAYVAKHIEAIAPRKTQREIAREVGWARPNMVSMVKTGEAKLPLSCIPALARAIDADPAVLMRLAFEEQWPGELRAINQVFGTVLSSEELELILHARSCGDGALGRSLPELKSALDRRIM